MNSAPKEVARDQGMNGKPLQREPSKEVIDFHDVYNSYGDKVRRILGRLLPWNELDDAVQETFVKVFHSLPDFKGDAKIETWLYRITVNTAYDFNRKRKSLSSLISRWVEHQDKQVSPSLDQKMLVQDALMKLPFKDRTVLVLHYLEGYKQDEIADLLDIPQGTVKSRLHHARIKMESILKEDGYE